MPNPNTTQLTLLQDRVRFLTNVADKLQLSGAGGGEDKAYPYCMHPYFLCIFIYTYLDRLISPSHPLCLPLCLPLC